MSGWHHLLLLCSTVPHGPPDVAMAGLKADHFQSVASSAWQSLSFVRICRAERFISIYGKCVNECPMQPEPQVDHEFAFEANRNWMRDWTRRPKWHRESHNQEAIRDSK